LTLCISNCTEGFYMSDIEKAYEFINFRTTIVNQKHLLLAQVEERLTCYLNGGVFRAEPGFIAFIGDIINSGYESAPILDVNNNPILIKDLSEFKNTLLSSYMEVVYDYWKDWEDIRVERDLKKIADV